MEIEKLVKKLVEQIPQERIRIAEPMAYHTSFRIGGPADVLVTPHNLFELKSILKLCHAYKIPVYVIGKGTNLLVRDKGIRGVVVKIGETFSQVRFAGTKVIAGAGIGLGDLAKLAGEQGLSGLEFAVGIPGSLGGAVTMNAGAYEGQMQDVVEAVLSVDMEGGVSCLCKEQLNFGYRQSILQQGRLIAVEVTLVLKPGDKEAIKAKMAEFTARREAKQPLHLPSAGSVFKRPAGHFAGGLIEAAGLKGASVGGAQVSELHAGFIVNRGNATAVDVLNLIKKIQTAVKANSGVDLVPEIRIIGEE